ncbi:GntR family transcriptional regulator [Isoptericola sp. b441]|uniref:GntR family transcriptional regulator n=1 Tax=Actinotalea lenta TaxID=3064654 RepID=A0ABT9DBN8_9CELL|nr:MULTISPECIES: GntR family transcriptional regulator [unclassified Isoptericola]MDO8106618.1 GntR family transcriptional regulator [Isoptericola sp. b441]MDO8121674.1 GntR family transcriptional regulator [Isoptericola sp. b490]
MPQPLRVELDRSSPVPLYHQVAQAIQAAIDDGRLPSGALLENEVSLAARLGISRPTARQALRELVDKGRLVRRRGAGTRVAPAAIRRPADLTSLFDDLNRAGRSPSTTVLEHRTVPASPEVAEALDLAEGAAVVATRRLRLADGEPLAVLGNFLPVSIAPDRVELESDGLYACLRTRGVMPRVANRRIGARSATAAEARLLGEPARAALLTVEGTAFDETGTPVEFGRHVYRASRYTFDATLFVG